MLAEDGFIGPVTAHGCTTLRNTIIVMVTENIHLGLVITQQCLSGDGFITGSHTAACAIVALIHHINVTNRAGANKEALRIILLQPGTEQVVVTGMIRCGIALGEAGQSNETGLIGKFCCRDGHAVFLGGSEQQIRLVKRHGFVSGMNTGAIGNGNQQFAIDRLHKVQQIQPLLFGQHILKALGSFAAALSVEVIVGLICPGAGDTDPCSTQLFCKFDQPGVCSVDRIVPLLQIAHIGPILDDGELFCTINLCFAVGFPESATGNFRHLDVVRNQSLIDFTQSRQIAGVQLYEFCHKFSLL